MVELSASQGAFLSCHLCWGGIFGDTAVKNTSYGVEKLLHLTKTAYANQEQKKVWPCLGSTTWWHCMKQKGYQC